MHLSEHKVVFDILNIMGVTHLCWNWNKMHVTYIREIMHFIESGTIANMYKPDW